MVIYPIWHIIEDYLKYGSVREIKHFQNHIMLILHFKFERNNISQRKI